MKNIEKELAIADILYKSLREELSGDEKAILECWLKDEDNRKFYLSMQEPENLFEDVLEMLELDTQEYYRKTQQQIRRKHRLRILRIVLATAAVLLPAFWLLAPLVQQKPEEETIPYVLVQQAKLDHTTLETGEGKVYYLADSVKKLTTKRVIAQASPEKKQPETVPSEENFYNILTASSRSSIEVMLSDSTRVWLNAGSQLRYPHQFKSDKREVELLGEAYFDVKHNKQKPFIVKTPLALIKVLGTQFDVNCKDDKNCITTLVEGSVKVHNVTGDSIVIRPGEQACASSLGEIKVQTVDPRYVTAWKRDRFAFQDKALWYIMSELSTWYGFTFDFSDWELAQQHFTTIVPRYPTIEEVLNILQVTQSFSYVESGDGHIRITKYTNH